VTDTEDKNDRNQSDTKCLESNLAQLTKYEKKYGYLYTML